MSAARLMHFFFHFRFCFFRLSQFLIRGIIDFFLSERNVVLRTFLTFFPDGVFHQDVYLVGQPLETSYSHFIHLEEKITECYQMTNKYNEYMSLGTVLKQRRL